ncbi:MAG: cellulase family glycosylhydrolase [Dermatophilus congolensis]|nr:cellulase family glycosylhydrolase [Dermatophilus congolensis]
MLASPFTTASASPDKGPTWAHKSGMSVPAYIAWGSQADLERTLDQVAATGVTWFRFDLPWSQISWEPGQADYARFDRVVDAALSRGLKPLGILSTLAPYARPAGATHSYGPRTDAQRAAFAGFVKQAVNRYKGKVSHWEIWNEPNLDQYWAPTPNPADYVALLRVSTPVIRSACPSCTIVSGGTGGATDAPDMTPLDWYTGVYANAPQGLFDAVGVHPYSDLRHGWGGEMSTVPAIRAVMAKGGHASMPIWATEAGYSTAGQHSVTESDAARMMREAVAAWREVPHHGPFFWYTMQDVTDPSGERHMGLLRLDGSPKPSHAALVSMNKEYVGESLRAAMAPVVTAEATDLTTEGGTTRGTFTLTTSAPLRVKMVLVAVRDASGGNRDVLAARDTVLVGRQSFSGKRAALPQGTYTYGVAWQTLDGTWHGPGFHGRHTVGAARSAAGAALFDADATLVSDARGTRATMTTYADGSVPAKAVIVAVRDQAGRLWDVWGAANTTLAGIQTRTASREPLPAGTYTYAVAYQGSDGVWRGIRDDKKQTLVVP